MFVFFSVVAFGKTEVKASETVEVDWKVTQYDVAEQEVTVNFTIPESSGRLGYYYAQGIATDDGLSRDEMFQHERTVIADGNSVDISICFGESNFHNKRIYFFVTDETQQGYVIPNITNQKKNMYKNYN